MHVVVLIISYENEYRYVAGVHGPGKTVAISYVR